MFRKTLLTLLFALTFTIISSKAYAAENINIYLFWGSGCPHCAKEKPFLEKLKNKYPEAKIYDFEVWYNPANAELLKKVGKKLDADISGVPFTIIGEKSISGYLNDETTGREIEDALRYCIKQGCADPAGQALGFSAPVNTKIVKIERETIPETIALPLLGTIKTKDFSLPALTIIIGALDGFNPCAMWTLLFLLSLLVGMHNRTRMWILGTTFIVTSAFIYFLFMTAWLHLILFIGFIFWIRLAIGILGLGAGFYNLREYMVNKNATCKVTNNQERRRVFEGLKHFAQERHFWIAIGGIILLAAAVNIVELICSAGFPVIYTQILTLSNLPVWQYYLYLLLYIFIFLLDDLFVFIVTLKTLLTLLFAFFGYNQL